MLFQKTDTLLASYKQQAAASQRALSDLKAAHSSEIQSLKQTISENQRMLAKYRQIVDEFLAEKRVAPPEPIEVQL